ncbi:anhydro-N-acetylmuramic acid kinase [Sulfurimonas sp. SAG-AH-194-C21]|nr:anhydro-N-acetylmuramic acid kinase [Sulfurimonas sp. SAG-AH-194-C21]MDF1883068.1 anhydro-N-acetylmuramic acid kinase [Sulfurimonas sp. SAG-AH-194-C21]
MHKKELYIGVMSGTSLDGVDIALCEITDTSCELLKSYEYPFDLKLKNEIFQMISTPTTLKNVGELDHKLGFMFSDAINAFVKNEDIDTSSITAIGLHGQTLWHSPDGDTPFSMQLGDANIVCAQTGIRTIADFRRMDIANGGQGAPFAPAFHKFLFAHLEKKVAVLNIGGMANITILDEKTLGWDAGCGNVLLDWWMSQTQLKPYDKDGDFARSGKLSQALLALMLQDEYFSRIAPKSTGREYFNALWIEEKLTKFEHLCDNDIQRTLLELTAQTIANDLKDRNITTIIVCGGGARNTFLIQRLEELTTCELKRSDELGINSDALEAMAFAWFAYKRSNKQLVDLCSITGATKPSQLGAIYG